MLPRFEFMFPKLYLITLARQANAEIHVLLGVMTVLYDPNEIFHAMH